MLKLAINIDVDNLQKGVAFYTEAFGGAQAPVYILQKVPAAPPFPGAENRRLRPPLDARARRSRGRRPRARRGSRRKASAHAESELESYPWGRMVLMADPFGHGFCLIQLDAVGYEAMTTPY